MTSENSSKKDRLIPDHLRVPWGVKDAIVVYILPWVVLPILIVIALSLLSPYIPLARSFLSALQANSVQANFTLVLIDAIVELVIVALYLKKYKAGWKSVGWRKFSILQAIGLVLLMLIIFTLGVAALTTLVAYLIPSFNADQAQTNEFTSQTRSHPSISLIALVILPPIIEETVFRGFIFPAMSKKYGLVFGAIVTSVLFGIAHLQANVSVYTFVLSLVLCFMYVRLRSIIPGIALHMLNNYLAFVAIGVK